MFVMGIPALLLLTHSAWLVGAGALVLTALLVGAFLSWWLPYITGISVYKYPNGESWSHVYERIFAQTIIVLPRLKDPNRPTPNVEHMILHTLIAAATVASWLYCFQLIS